MKRILSFVLAICMLSGMLAVEAFAADAPTSGKCGDNLTWTLDGSKLTISGTGPMYDYSTDNPAPWNEVASKFSFLEIQEGVTTIGEEAFLNTEITSSIYIWGNLEYIGDYAFGNNSGICYFMGAAPQIAENAFKSAFFKKAFVINWSDEEKQRLGNGFFIWDGIVELDVVNSKHLVGLNEELKAEELAFTVKFDNTINIITRAYTPRQVEIVSCDNSTYGEKTLTVTADGFTFEMPYFVTDGSNHLDLIQVELNELPYYYSPSGHSSLYLTVKMGTMALRSDMHYDVSVNAGEVGTFGQFTITGKAGLAEGYEKTFYYPVLRNDLSKAKVNSQNQGFAGIPVTPDKAVSLFGMGEYLENTDYLAFYENNVNIGTATVGAVGIGNCYGVAKGTFSITNGSNDIKLQGNYLGKADGELSQDVPIYEMVISPGKLTGRVDSSGYNVAAYGLYELKGEEAELIYSKETDVGTVAKIAFNYDFSSVYEDYAEDGGAVYLLSYSWVNENLDVYGGATILYVPAKVADATSMTMNHIADDGDFRNEYLYVTGDDGALGEITWTSSDPAVATVDGGVVTLNKPGTAEITAQYGELAASHTVTAETLDLTQGIIYDYSPDSGEARVVHDGRVLTAGVDYQLSVRQKSGGVEVTATGCGLFAGELVKLFDGVDSFADPHTHGFDNGSDITCNSCDWIRHEDHVFDQNWSKDSTHHWHVCTVCGDKVDFVAHTISPDDPEYCTVCGILYIPGIHTHRYEEVNVDPTCTEPGYRGKYCPACGDTVVEENFELLGHDMAAATCTEPATCQRENCGYQEGNALGHAWEDPCLTTRTCSVCGYTDDNGGHDWYNPAGDARYCYACGIFEGGYLLDLTEIGDVAWIDGVEYPSISKNENPCILIPHADAKTMVTYSYANTDSTDPHLQYPTGMKVWKLHVEGDYYKPTYIEEFDNLLQYAGSSIRITGTKGIRMITGIDKTKKAALTGDGLAGYTLVEYGTALCWASNLQGNQPMVLGQDYVKSNYAYKKGVADPIFAQTKDAVQYTNVLVGFTLDQCSDDIAMRPYIVLEDAEGNQITIYGGIVYRSIGYIAYQNRNVFRAGTSSYKYVWEIIHKVYGKKYDAEYKG